MGFGPVFCGGRSPTSLRFGSVQKQSGWLPGKPTGAINRTVVVFAFQPAGNSTFGTVTIYDPSGALIHVAPGKCSPSSWPCCSGIVIPSQNSLGERCKNKDALFRVKKLRCQLFVCRVRYHVPQGKLRNRPFQDDISAFGWFFWHKLLGDAMTSGGKALKRLQATII